MLYVDLGAFDIVDASRDLGALDQLEITPPAQVVSLSLSQATARVVIF